MTKLQLIVPAFAIGAMSLFTGCKSASTADSDCCGCSTAEVCETPVFELPTTAAQQSDATPDAVLDQLMQGNARYVAGVRTAIDIDTSREMAAQGQWPLAYVLSCVDSRVPVEVVFDQGIGDIFVGRVAGNFENVDQMGSMEFATAAAGSKLVIVLGHGSCGAVQGAIGQVELGNLTALLGEIEPSVQAAIDAGGTRDATNPAFVQAVIEANVRQTVADLRERSEVLAGLESEGKIKIVGAVYSLETGEVTLLD